MIRTKEWTFKELLTEAMPALATPEQYGAYQELLKWWCETQRRCDRLRKAVEEVTGIKTWEGERGDAILIAHLALRKDKTNAERHSQGAGETSQASETDDQASS